jgi:hypothetical protein
LNQVVRKKFKKNFREKIRKSKHKQGHTSRHENPRAAQISVNWQSALILHNCALRYLGLQFKFVSRPAFRLWTHLWRTALQLTSAGDTVRACGPTACQTQKAPVYKPHFDAPQPAPSENEDNVFSSSSSTLFCPHRIDGQLEMVLIWIDFACKQPSHRFCGPGEEPIRES